MTPEQLAAIKARADAAHKPPTFCGSFNGCHFTDGAGFDPCGIHLALTATREDVPALLAEVERLEGLVSRIATAAVRYDARVYALSDDFLAIEPYLSDEDRATLGERPSDAAHRTAAERDEARARAEKAEAKVAAVEALCDDAPEALLPTGDFAPVVTVRDLRAAIAEAGGAS